MANVEHAVPVTADTVFQSGSVGKQFTAAAILSLVEDGKIGLDDPVAKYLPEAPASWAPIRIHHLLTHTSGIPDYATESFDYRGDYDDAKIVALARELPLDFPAGSRWKYSNTGYALLGIIIDRVTGRHYSELLRERIFTPLGMRSARLIDEASIVPHRAAGYRRVHGELANQEWVSPTLNTTADGSLYLSLNDMIAWDAGLRAGRVLSAASWQRIYTPVTLTDGTTYPYGYGWYVSKAPGQEIHEHGGAWQGFKTYIRRYLGDDVTVIVLANLGDADPARFTDHVAAAWRPKLAGQSAVPAGRE
jgi:CubicO group peptidase (beta-lactamase class C family)